MTDLVAGWMLTYLVHSTLLLFVAWLTCRGVSDSRLALRETVWRLALFGGLLTASLQLATGVEPFGGSWTVALPERAEAAPRLEPALPAPTLSTIAKAQPTLPPVSPGTTPSPAPPSWNRWLARGWAAAALPLLLLLALSYVHFRWRLRDRTDLDDDHLLGFLRRLESRIQPSGRAVRLTRSSRIGVPLARGLRRQEICLPTEVLERLPSERREIVVAHELAHLRRRDPLWFGLTRLVERALFFQPLNALARRRLQEIAEFRCDDWAVAVTRRPISLARCLTEVAGWRLAGRSLPVPTMSAGKTQLSRRVSRLLERSYPMPSPSTPRWLMPVASIVLLLVVLIAPTISAHSAVEPAADPGLAPLAPPPAPPAPEAPPPPPPVTPGSPAVAPLPPAPTAPAPPVPPIAPKLVLGDLPELAIESARLAAELDIELQTSLLPLAADLAVAIDPAIAAEQAALAAHIADAWVEDLELDREQVARLRELTERLERAGRATEAETAKLAALAQTLIETARPSSEALERLREQAREAAEARRRLMEEHRERMLELEGAELEAREQARAEIERSLDERRELIERARREREESIRGLEREQRDRLREEMIRSRERLREQLRLLDEELERMERGGLERH